GTDGDIVFHNLYQLLIACAGCVETEVIISRVIPVSSRMVLIIIGTIFVSFFNFFDDVLFRAAILCHGSQDTILPGGIEKQLDDIRLILQDKVRTAADDNTGFCPGQLFDTLCLEVKQIILGSEIITVRRENLSLIDLFADAEQRRTLYLFIHLPKQRLIDTALL